jgi:subtilisin family serine protease
MSAHRLPGLLATVTAVVTQVTPASAQPVDGAALVRLLGPRAKAAFAPPGAPGMGGLVRLPHGVHAADLGLPEVAPGFARVWGTASSIVSFADAHPDLRVEVSPPLHLLLDNATSLVRSTVANASGFDGKNVLIGIADTGIDLTHPNFRDATGGTRVQWLLDLSRPPVGKHPDLEQLYDSTDVAGHAVGAVWAKADIDALLTTKGASTEPLPKDDVGHGTLVAACAAAQDSRYPGVAPQAGLLIARITDSNGVEMGNDELLRGVAFLFDRADALHEPVVVNLSLGSDFGPHDGTLAWEQALASQVGSSRPGRSFVAAAGNSGSVVESPIHQTIHVNRGEQARVPLLSPGASQNGSVNIWVSMHSGADLRVGLDAPDGTWISPVGNNDTGGRTTSDYGAAIYNGSQASGGQVPAESHGAVIIWQGAWPAGIYWVSLSGSGTADLYLQSTDDNGNPGIAAFLDGVREGTINLPATHPAIIGVGCTISKASWLSVSGGKFALHVPVLDPAGGEPSMGGEGRDPIDGEPCWFSSAGPTLTGVLKPEIMAPGAAIVGALSQDAIPPTPTSIFTCESVATADGGGPNCQQVDATHGVSKGTSFSAPIVAGAVALLLQYDPTLTQDEIVAALQGGAHRLRSAAPFNDQAGVAELDVVGALSAVDRLHNPRVALPVRSESWLTLGSDLYLADGSTPIEAILELRAARQGAGSAVPADGFTDDRLAVYALVDGSPQGAPPVRRAGPGVWVASLQLPAGLGGRKLTVGVTFDGVDIVEPKSVPIATDVWNAAYAPSARGGCAVSSSNDGNGLGEFAVLGGAILACSSRSPLRRSSRASHRSGT